MDKGRLVPTRRSTGQYGILMANFQISLESLQASPDVLAFVIDSAAMNSHGESRGMNCWRMAYSTTITWLLQGVRGISGSPYERIES